MSSVIIILALILIFQKFVVILQNIYLIQNARNLHKMLDDQNKAMENIKECIK